MCGIFSYNAPKITKMIATQKLSLTTNILKRLQNMVLIRDCVVYLCTLHKRCFIRFNQRVDDAALDLPAPHVNLITPSLESFLCCE